MEYLPYGETLVDEHLNSYNTPFKFNGKEVDDETGNYYYGARYYNPKTSIWLSVDPLAEKYSSISSYAYVAQNPLKYIDPDGKKIKWAKGIDRKQKRILRKAIRKMRRKSSTFNNMYKDLDQSGLVFTIKTFPKGHSSYAYFNRPEMKFKDSEIEIDGEIFTTSEPYYDMSDGAAGGNISFNVYDMQDMERDLSTSALKEAKNVIPEEFSGAALFLFYNTSDLQEPASGNIEFETKMLSGVILNEAGEPLSRGDSQTYAEQFGIDYFKGNNTSNYQEALKNWHSDAKKIREYQNTTIDNQPPTYTDKTKN